VYFDAFSFGLGFDRLTFWNISMGNGRPIPEFTVSTWNANLTFTQISYLDKVGFDVWVSDTVVGPLQWYGYFWGMDDGLQLYKPQNVSWAGASWPQGTYWNLTESTNLINTYWVVPPTMHVLFDWYQGLWNTVETWTVYPYTGTSPDLGGGLPIPIMSIMGIIGLVSMFAGPLYGISKFKKHEYYGGAIVGLVVFVLGFALFIAWLWST